MTVRWSRPPCGGCTSNRRRVQPEYPTCKQDRLCDLVDPGLLRFHLDCESLESYLDAQSLLLRGQHELQLFGSAPLPTTPEDFVEAVREAHRRLFRHVLPEMAGEFRGEARGDLEETVFGGDGVHRREAWSHDRIIGGVKTAFHLAMMGDSPASRSAAFLAHFFRVHPFADGNGRVGRFFVEKIIVEAGKRLKPWGSSGKSRRRYLCALEYAHKHHVRMGAKANCHLERWIERHVEEAPDDDDESLA